MTPQEQALDAFANWYGRLSVHKSSGGPAKGTIGAALVVLEHLKSSFNLDLSSHRAAGGSQIRGSSGPAVARILKEFGEVRPFAKEGGRTNRGGPGDIQSMLIAVKDAQLDLLLPDERILILTELQSFLVARVRDFHNRERLKMLFNPGKSTWQSIHDLLALARETGKEGAVAQYLVGAKLQLRFPEIAIGNESYTTADDQLDRPGDYHIGDTAFHITVAPMPAVYEKCKRNIEQGLRAYLLVPDRVMIGTRQTADSIVTGPVHIESIETFVSQNVEELSMFSKDQLVHGFRHLLEIYNHRVDAAEIDKSIMIEIPRNLQ